MNNLKAIIFDMDGVIVDSEALSVASEKSVLDKNGIVIDEADWATFKGKTSVAIFSFIIEKYNLKNLDPIKMREEKIGYYMDLFEKEISMFTGFMELINYLRPKYRIALTTSSGKDIQDRVFSRFDLHKYFDEIVTSDLVTNGKPHPEPYLLTLEKLGLCGDECVAVEDSDNGVTSAKSAGIKTVAVTHTFPKEKLAHSDFIVNNLLEIKNLV